MAEAMQLQQLRNQSMSQQESKNQVVSMGFFDLQGFELLQRVAKAFCSSNLVPVQYQGNLPNTMIAMDMAHRMRANPLMVMQNLYVVHGTPGWSSKFLIATVNLCGRFTSLRYEWKGKPGTPEFGCRAWAVEHQSDERLDGIWVTWEMVRNEGWHEKKGSKWKTMPDQMFVYRAAAFWQRAYAPELAMGMQTAEEIQDTYDASRSADGSYSVDIDSLREASNASPKDVKSERKDEPTHQQEEEPPVGPSEMFEDALSAAKSGDRDMALDLCRSLTDDEAQVIRNTLNQAESRNTSAQQNQGSSRSSSRAGGMSME